MTVLLRRTGIVGGQSPYYPVSEDCYLYHAYWDGTATDHSGKGNNGILVGAPEFVENGLSFNGVNQWVHVLGSDILECGLNSISIGVWLNALDQDSPCLFQPHNLYDGLYHPGFAIYIYGDIHWACVIDDSIHTVDLTTGHPYPFGSWNFYFFLLRRSETPSKRVEVWKNGVLQTAVPSLVSITDAITMATDFHIAGNTPYGMLFKGTFGEFYFHKNTDPVLESYILSVFNATKARYGL